MKVPVSRGLNLRMCFSIHGGTPQVRQAKASAKKKRYKVGSLYDRLSSFKADCKKVAKLTLVDSQEWWFKPEALMRPRLAAGKVCSNHCGRSQ